MSFSALGLVFLIGLLFFGGWPILANASNIKDPFVRGFLVNAVTALGFLPFLRGRLSFEHVTSSGGKILLIAGLLNMTGHILLPRLQTMPGSQLSLYMAMIPALCVVASIIGGPLFYHDPVTLPRMFFTMLILIGITGLAYTSRT